MKIDLAGKKDRGLAMGLNEFAGYLAVAVVAFLTGWIASEYGLRPYPFYLGIALAGIGLLMSIAFVKDTAPWVKTESTEDGNEKRSKENLFWKGSFGDRNLFAVSQSGMATNLKDGMAWGIFPLYLAVAGLDLYQIGIVTGIYPAFWGVLQVVTGKISDFTGRKNMLLAGLMVQAGSLLIFPLLDHFYEFVIVASFLGIGTAMVYPTFLAAVADLVHPEDRAESIGVFRLWRDGGYAVGALLAGILADMYDLGFAITITGIIVMISGITLLFSMNKLKQPIAH